MATIPFRKTWLAAGSVFAVASLGWGVFQVTGLIAYDKQEFHESLTATAAGPISTIDIDNDTGSVKIIGTDRSDVTINGEVVRGLTAPDHSERVVGTTLEIDATCFPVANFCSVDYDIQVPRDVNLKVRAAGGGIRVSNVTGTQDLASSGGGLRVEGAQRDLQLHTSGGGITAIALESGVVDASSSGGNVRLEFVDDPRHVDASSSGGGVTVVIPDDEATYDIQATSSDGSVSRDVRSDPDSNRTIRMHSSAGGVTVRYPDSP